MFRGKRSTFHFFGLWSSSLAFISLPAKVLGGAELLQYLKSSSLARLIHAMLFSPLPLIHSLHSPYQGKEERIPFVG